jgi:hypothetical protein
MMFRLHKLLFSKLLPAVVFLCMLSILVTKAEEPLTLTAGQMFHHYVRTNTTMLQYAIISQGCSGSSATYQFVNDIFVAHGMNNLFPVGGKCPAHRESHRAPGWGHPPQWVSGAGNMVGRGANSC